MSHEFWDISWLTMKNRFELHSTCLFRSIGITKKPPYLAQKLRYRRDVHNVNIGKKDTLDIPKHNLKLHERSFSYQVTVTLNKLPADVKTISSTAFHRETFKKLFHEQCCVN